MPQRTLEERVKRLESQVAELQGKLNGAKSNGSKPPARNAWLDTVEKLAGDEDLQSIFREAMKIREADRKRTRPRSKSTARKRQK